MSVSTEQLSTRPGDHRDLLSSPRQLSETDRKIISETLPVIGAHINDITPVFYSKLFDTHPELIRDLFNRGNQKQGAQQRALAASIATFASHLVEGKSPVDLLSRIGHKHASLGIREDQYQVVHDNLFAAIVEVLGDAITPEIAGAWDEVYWILAETLIGFERALYADAGVEPGEVFRTARVVGREDVTDDVAVFTLRATDGSALPASRPGQYITVGARLDDGARQLRQYSLMGAPGEEGGGTWRIGVRRVDEGTAPAGEVSTWLHRNLTAGSEVEVTLPFGDLTLAHAGLTENNLGTPVVLCSAGIGITPMLGLLSELESTQFSRPVTILHADRSPAEHVLRSEVSGAAESLSDSVVHSWYESGADTADGPGAIHTGLMDLSEVDIPAGAHVFLCGGTGFLEAQRSALAALGVTEDRVHAELFAPNDWLV